MLNSLMIRVAAGGILLTGATLYALQNGLLAPLMPTAFAEEAMPEQTLASSSRRAGSMTPALPQFAPFDIRIPDAEQALAAEAGNAPALIEAPAFGAPNPMTETTELSDLGLPCAVTVTATAMPAAMVALDVSAPCRSGAAVTITHSGLEIIAETDPVGLLTLDVPAFETPAFFSVAFEDGLEETVLVGLPDLRDFDRIGLSWIGDMGLELHAMEFGAEFGGQGHIWQETPGNPDGALNGSGGFLTTVQTDVTYAQIYTLPRATLRAGDSVRLSIDAPVTPDNCTRGILARTLRAEGGSPVDLSELTFRMPDCDAVGDVLVLQNILDDLRLATN